MEHSPRTGGLQRKFFIALLIAGIVPGIVALIATYLYSTESLKHSIGSSFQEIARSTSIRIAAAVDMEIDRAVQLAATPVVVQRIVELANQRYAGKTEAEIEALLKEGPTPSLLAQLDQGPLPLSQAVRYLEEWARKDGHYVRVVLADSRGALVASNDPHAQFMNEDETWWEEAFDNGAGVAYVSSLHLDPDLNEYVFEVSVPVPGQDDAEPIGVVGLIISRQTLMDTILPIRVGETGHGMLLDTAGTPLVCPVLPPTEHLIQQALLSQLAQDRPSWLVVDDDAHGGHNSIIGVAPVRFSHRLTPLSLGGQRWFAFVRQQPEETYSPIYSLLLTVGLIGFGLVVVLASLGFVLGRQIVSPILALRREADALRRNLIALSSATTTQPAEIRSALPDIRTGDEIEDLAKTFEAMRRSLEDSLHTIRVQHDELVRKEKLASVGQLLAALAHDLRNPLGVIRSSAQLVLEEHQPDDIKQEVTRYIIDEVDKLTHRINDFLRYARQKPPEPKPISPEALVKSAVWQWKAQGGHERLSVVTQFQDGLPDLCVDPDQVKEALVNLLVNAREAMPNGGRVTIRAYTDGNAVLIEVADTGCGISEAHLHRIFEPFFTTKDYGTGLGLTNVKRLIEDNGGAIEVESELGKGSRFSLRFAAPHAVPRAQDRLELDRQAG
ncbi:ATP-binding protein [Candidatus Nitrospira bockiana]